MAKWDGSYDTRKTTGNIVQDALEYGVMGSNKLEGGGTEELKEYDDRAMLSVFYPDGKGGHHHSSVDSFGNIKHK